jgi:succinate dehydrogenase / fumarate reductase cytochrome b subunit
MQGLASAFPGDDMQRATTFVGSSIGRKLVMAVTGLVFYGFVVGHMTAVTLTLANWRARPVGYREWQARESNLASRTMVWSGPILAVFVIYHLAHLTWGNANADFVAGDVYHNVVVGFSNPFASAFYVLAMLALGLHMYHGFWSLLQTLGLGAARMAPLRTGLSLALAGIVVLANISVPIAVLAGIVHL